MNNANQQDQANRLIRAHERYLKETGGTDFKIIFEAAIYQAFKERSDSRSQESSKKFR